MAKSGPRRLYKYSNEFKAQAVRLSDLPGVQIKDVAESLAIHPFMLSLWRKQVREGVIVSKKKTPVDPGVAAELKAYRKLQRQHKRLQKEHEIVKKYIAWKAERKQSASKPSTRSKTQPR